METYACYIIENSTPLLKPKVGGNRWKVHRWQGLHLEGNVIKVKLINRQSPRYVTIVSFADLIDRHGWATVTLGQQPEESLRHVFRSHEAAPGSDVLPQLIPDISVVHSNWSRPSECFLRQQSYAIENQLVAYITDFGSPSWFFLGHPHLIWQNTELRNQIQTWLFPSLVARVL